MALHINRVTDRQTDRRHTLPVPKGPLQWLAAHSNMTATPQVIYAASKNTHAWERGVWKSFDLVMVLWACSWEKIIEFWHAKLFFSYYIKVLFSSLATRLITNQDNPIMPTSGNRPPFPGMRWILWMSLLSTYCLPFYSLSRVCFFMGSDAVLSSHGHPLPHGWFLQCGEEHFWEVQTLCNQAVSSTRYRIRQGL